MLKRGRVSDWQVAVVSSITLISGLIGTWEPLLVRLSSHPRLFNTLVPYELYHLSNTLTIAIGYMLIYLSINLYRRKKTAWWIAVALSALSAALQLARIGTEHIHWLDGMAIARELPSYSVLPSLAALVALFLARSAFTVRSAHESLLKALRVTGVLTVAVLAYGCIGFFLLDRDDFGLNFEIDDALIRTIKELTLVGNPDLQARTYFGLWFIESLKLSGSLAAAAIFMSAFQPIRYRLLTQPHERKMAAAILEKNGSTSLDLFKLLPDKSYFFSDDLESFIAYKTALGVAIALGDPSGPESSFASLIADFVDFAHERGWQVAFLQTTPRYLPLFEEASLKSVKVGEDGIVDIEQYMSKTINKKTFKSVVRKFDKDGYTLQKNVPPLAETIVDEAEAISNQWLALPGRRERGFSLGQFNRAELQENDLYIMRDKEKNAIAFVNQIRSYSPGEATIDMMRHKENAPSGAMDYVFAKLITELHNQGYQYFSLGLAALSGVGESATDTLEEKALHQVYEHLNRFFSYKGLRAYKDKFDPRWDERFLIYEGGVPGLVKTGLAIARATEE
jgi:phosphatidylglycerol lysyltransferase